jgi:hypothetical protein
MKKENLIVILMIVALIFCSCNSAGNVDGNNGGSSESYASSGETDSGGSEKDAPKETQLYEYSDEEKTLLSIDMDKVDFFYECYEAGNDGKSLEVATNKYPDITLKESYGAFANNDIGEVWREVWHSKFTGLFYDFGCWRSINDMGSARYTLTEISGQADSLIKGLIAPIESKELMNLIDTPEMEWAIGESPKIGDDIRYYWTGDFYKTAGENDVCIVVETSYQETLPGTEKFLIGIEITANTSGFISPEDEIIIRHVVWREVGL